MSLKYNSKLISASLAFAALSLIAARPVHAQTTVDGSYDNGTNGYTTTSGDYAVVAPATFDHNSDNGFQAFITGSTVTITGGEFDDNGNFGLTATHGTVIVENGDFSGNGTYGFSTGLHEVSYVYGGDYSGNTVADFDASNSAITIYGDFVTYGVLATGTGSFTGTLQNDTTSQTFTYLTAGTGTITLAPETVPSVPEPSSIALFALGALGLIGLGIRARKRGLVGCG